jgi:hypothetical protein
MGDSIKVSYVFINLLAIKGFPLQGLVDNDVINIVISDHEVLSSS